MLRPWVWDRQMCQRAIRRAGGQKGRAWAARPHGAGQGPWEGGADARPMPGRQGDTWVSAVREVEPNGQGWEAGIQDTPGFSVCAGN